MSLSHILTPENLSPHLLRMLPPPRALGHGLRLIPPDWQGRMLTKLMNRLVVSALPPDTLAFLEQRKLAIEVGDLGLRWVFMGNGNNLQALPAETPAEATICGKMLDLLLLASQLEDPDTLFFQRRNDWGWVYAGPCRPTSPAAAGAGRRPPTSAGRFHLPCGSAHAGSGSARDRPAAERRARR